VPPLHGDGHWFESSIAHWEHSSVVEQCADNAEVDSSNLSVPIDSSNFYYEKMTAIIRAVEGAR